MPILRILLIVLPAWCLLAFCLPEGLPKAWGQDRPTPVEIRAYYGPDEVAVGEVANFRVWIHRESTAPISYLWDFGDGTLSKGGLVAHRYRSVGTYTIRVVARNQAGRDTLVQTITVVPAPPEDSPVARATPSARSERQRASRRSEAARATANRTDRASGADNETSAEERSASLYGAQSILPQTAGYSWVLASELWPERLNEDVIHYRLEGFRTDVYVDREGMGGPAYRLLVGHFPTIDAALAARDALPPTAYPPILHAFGPESREAVIAWARKHQPAFEPARNVAGNAPEDRPPVASAQRPVSSEPEAAGREEAGREETGGTRTASVPAPSPATPSPPTSSPSISTPATSAPTSSGVWGIPAWLLFVLGGAAGGALFVAGLVLRHQMAVRSAGDVRDAEAHTPSDPVPSDLAPANGFADASWTPAATAASELATEPVGADADESASGNGWSLFRQSQPPSAPDVEDDVPTSVPSPSDRPPVDPGDTPAEEKDTNDQHRTSESESGTGVPVVPLQSIAPHVTADDPDAIEIEWPDDEDDDPFASLDDWMDPDLSRRREDNRTPWDVPGEDARRTDDRSGTSPNER